MSLEHVSAVYLLLSSVLVSVDCVLVAIFLCRYYCSRNRPDSMSSGSDEAPAKKTRKRSREDSAEGFSVTDQGHTQYQQGAVWFDDGNVILVAEATAFRIYRGVLMGVSEVFRDMFMIPQPPDAERWEGCPIVHLSDTAADLNHVLSVLYKVGGVDRGLYV